MKKTITKLLLIMITTFSLSNVNAQYYQKILPGQFPNSVNVSFGKNVELDDSVAIISDRTGYVYIYRYTNSLWVKEKSFSGTLRRGLGYDAGTATGNYGGSALSIEGDLAVVGSYLDDEVKSYKFNGSTWVLEETITPASSSEYFGNSVAMEGNLMVIGAPKQPVQLGIGLGEAFLYEYNGANWIEKAKFTASDTSKGTHSNFGSSVAISGSTIVVSAPTDNEYIEGGGAVYVYEWDGNSLSEIKKLKVFPSLDTNSHFGSAIAISNDRILVAGNQLNYNGFDKAGRVFSFQKSAGTWNQSTVYNPSNASSSNILYGSDVDIDRDPASRNLIISQRTSSNKGVVYRFSAALELESTIQPVGIGNGDYFGESLCLSKNKLIVGSFFDDQRGSNKGAAYVFDFCASDVPDQYYTVCNGDSIVVLGTTYLNNAEITENLKNGDNCDSIIKHHIRRKNPSILTTTKSDTTMCQGDSLRLNVTGIGLDSILWTNNIISNELFFVGTVDSFNVTAINNYGCTSTATVNIDLNLNPIINLVNQSICDTETVVLNAGNFETYLWNTNDTTQTLEVISNVLDTGVFSYSVQVYDTNGCFNTGFAQISIRECIADTTTSIGRQTQASNISIFPNPNNGIVNLNIELDATKNVAFQILDILGKEVAFQNIGEVQHKIVPIDMTDLSEGVYFLKLTIGAEIITRKIIKK